MEVRKKVEKNVKIWKIEKDFKSNEKDLLATFYFHFSPLSKKMKKKPWVKMWKMKF